MADTMSDAHRKVIGAASYSADVSIPGLTHARVLLSSFAAAAIGSIDTTEAESAPGVLGVFTAANLPTAGQPARDRNSAILATDRVVWQGQPVAAVVAASEAAAADAVRKIRVEYTPSDPVTNISTAAEPGSKLVWPLPVERGEGASAEVHAGGAASSHTEDVSRGNISATEHFTRGSIDEGLGEADKVVTLTLRTEAVHQAYLEPHSVIAVVDPVDGTLTLYTATQSLFGTRNGVSRLLGVPREKVRIVPVAMGGGFGARYGIFEPLAGALAMATNRPVRLAVTRIEDFASTTPAPATEFRVTAGGTYDGRLTALQAEILAESGAFAAGLAGLIGNLFASVYRSPHIDVVSHEVLTNKSMVGAYRAPGAPQAAFALESLMDELARALGADQLRFRLDNACQTGDPMGNGDPWPHMGLSKVIERAMNHPLWKARTETAAGRGLGVAVGGWPGGTAPAAAVCRADSDGMFYLHVGSIDITGTNVALRRIAAEQLGIDESTIRVINGDSSTAPQSGPAGGSMVTYTVGAAVREAAVGARQQILEIAAKLLEASVDDLEISQGVVHVKGSPGSEIPVTKITSQGARLGGRFAPITAHGRSAITDQSPGFTVQLVEVDVDTETGVYEVVRNVVIQDVGHAISPSLVAGQMHGGAAQGIGWATQEQLAFDESGTMTTGTFSEYLIPDATQVPAIEAIMVDNPSPHGPMGARGVAEAPIVAGPAAVANAVRDAVGARITELPITSERVWAAVQRE